MNKRDKIALEAMKAIIGKSPARENDMNAEETARAVALGAYFYADAMLAVRNEYTSNNQGNQMKFDVQYDKTFTPVTFTLETQSEVDNLYIAVAESDSYHNGLEEFLVEFASEELVDEFCEDCRAEELQSLQEFLAQSESYMLCHQEADGDQREHPCQQGCEACVGCNSSDSMEDYEKAAVFEPYNIRVETEGFARMLADVFGNFNFGHAYSEYGIEQAKLADIASITQKKVPGHRYTENISINKIN